MNRSRIEWCDYVFNPITGCRKDCEYCYARKMTVRFSGDIRMNLSSNNYKKEGELFILEEKFMAETGGVLSYPFGFSPTFHKYRLNTLEDKKNGFNIFVGAMADIFGDWIPDEWINEVFKACEKYEQHNYLFLTKNPERYCKLILPSKGNMWYGTTITNRAEIEKFNWLPAFNKTFVSIEPLLEDIQPKECSVMFRQVDWIIIGAETGSRKNKTVPECEWIRKIVLEADSCGVPVFMKDSLISIIGEKNMRREFPKQLLQKEVSEKVKARLEDKCCQCGTHMRKSHMITLSARSKRGEMPKQLCFMCHPCFIGFCNNSNIKIPKLEQLKNKEEK